MIKVTQEFGPYNRNLGNKLFTYSVGRIFAKVLGVSLKIPTPSLIQRNKIVQNFPYFDIYGKIVQGTQYYVSDESMFRKGLNVCLKESKDKEVFLDGYFLKYDYIKPFKEFIKNIYSDLRSKNDNKNDVVIMLRDSNCDATYKLPDDYYLKILENIQFTNLYVCYDHYEKHTTLLNSIQKFSPIFVDLPILDMFRLITSKNTIIAAQGTFSFWACFLSEANTIYWPIPQQGPNNPSWCVNLTVDDEERFKFINL